MIFCSSLVEWFFPSSFLCFEFSIVVTKPGSQIKVPGRSYVISWSWEGSFQTVSILLVDRMFFCWFVFVQDWCIFDNHKIKKQNRGINLAHHDHCFCCKHWIFPMDCSFWFPKRLLRDQVKRGLFFFGFQENVKLHPFNSWNWFFCFVFSWVCCKIIKSCFWICNWPISILPHCWPVQ